METIMLVHILAIALTASVFITKTGNKYKLAAACTILVLLAFLWIDTGFPPFINGRTSTLFFSSLLLFRSFIYLKKKTAFLTRISSLVIAVSGLFIPVATHKVDAVLSSFWLGIHVPLFFLGYLSLTISFISSFLNDEPTEKREAMLAVLFLFAGLFTGAIWAEISWGRFFGFDPKETWTLSLLITLSAYFISKNRLEQKFILRTAFILMLMTYLVVSFILPGMHSYV
jgi:ABC-type transport system involved in cytochrome c biogenesis permease subunit